MSRDEMSAAASSMLGAGNGDVACPSGRGGGAGVGSEGGEQSSRCRDAVICSASAWLWVATDEPSESCSVQLKSMGATGGVVKPCVGSSVEGCSSRGRLASRWRASSEVHDGLPGGEHGGEKAGGSYSVLSSERLLLEIPSETEAAWSRLQNLRPSCNERILLHGGAWTNAHRSPDRLERSGCRPSQLRVSSLIPIGPAALVENDDGKASAWGTVSPVKEGHPP